MLFIAIAFFLGDAWVQSLPVLDAAWLLTPALLALLVLWWAVRKQHISRHALVAFLCGLMWAGSHAYWQLRNDLQPELEGNELTVVGYIADIPQQESYGWRFLLVTDQTAAKRSGLQLPDKLQISWYSHTQQVHADERWQLLLKLKRRHGFANPGSFDYEGQLFREGIGATGYVRDSSTNQYLGMVPGNYVLRVRAYLAEQISLAIPDAPMQGVIRGLAVGDQQAISNAQWQVFARTGISHLIAISGSHIGVVSLLAAWLGGCLIHLPRAQRWRLTRPDLRALFGLPAALGYSLLAGMSVPTQRTLVMLLVYFGTQLLRREINVWHSFGLALLLVVLIDPFAPLAIGTWLSFGAVAVILLTQQGRVRRAVWWREFLTIQTVVTLGLMPLLIAAFGNVSLISPWVNMLAIPLFTAVLVPAVLLGCALLVIHAAWGAWWLGYVALLLDGVYAGLDWAAQLPLATWYVPQSPLWAMCLLGAGVLLLVLPLLWPMRYCGLLCCLPALLWQPASVPANSFELTVLDVGQGLSLVVRTASHVLVYDTGPKFQSGTDTGALVVLPYLHALGVRHIDTLMVSHGDDDHAGGMQSIGRGMPVTRWLLGPSVKTQAITDEGIRPQRCIQGQRWQWDGVQFLVLHPPLDDGRATGIKISDNNTSCVLRIVAMGGSALLLGDAEAPVERQLVAAQAMPQTGIVVAGHHGSRSSSTPELVAAVRAREVVFSAGYRNKWAFPKDDVVARWRDSGARTDSTIDGGAISLRVLPQGLQAVQKYREPQRHYWQLN